MSKLDYILFDYENIVLANPTTDLQRSSEYTKQQIKELMIEMLEFDHTSDNDDELLEKIKSRIDKL